MSDATGSRNEGPSDNTAGETGAEGEPTIMDHEEPQVNAGAPEGSGQRANAPQPKSDMPETSLTAFTETSETLIQNSSQAPEGTPDAEGGRSGTANDHAPQVNSGAAGESGQRANVPDPVVPKNGRFKSIVGKVKSILKASKSGIKSGIESSGEVLLDACLGACAGGGGGAVDGTGGGSFPPPPLV